MSFTPKRPSNNPHAGATELHYFPPFEKVEEALPSTRLSPTYLSRLMMSASPGVQRIEFCGAFQPYIEVTALEQLIPDAELLPYSSLAQALDQWFDGVIAKCEAWALSVSRRLPELERRMAFREEQGDILCDFSQFESCVHEEAFELLDRSTAVLELNEPLLHPSDSIAVRYLAGLWMDKFDRSYEPRPGWPLAEPPEDAPSYIPAHLLCCPIAFRN